MPETDAWVACCWIISVAGTITILGGFIVDAVRDIMTRK